MMWDDFYEPSEFDQQVEEWKEALKKSVKKEYMDEMERLRRENAELMDIKKNWSEKIHEIDTVSERLPDDRNTAPVIVNWHETSPEPWMGKEQEE